MKHAIVAAVLLAAPAAGVAQTGLDAHRAASTPTFRSAAEIVALAVTVVDERADHLPGRTLADFVVLEDGVEQPLAHFAAGATPIDITLLVDASASMGDKMGIVRQAVRGLTGALRPGDRAALVEFRETTTERQAMTGDRAALDAAIDRMVPAGNTALYTALYVTLSQMRTAPDMGDFRRQAIVVLSDGDDTASLVGYADVLDKAQRRGVAVYAVALQSPGAGQGLLRRGGTTPSTDGERALRQLARETGGAAFFPARLDQLRDVYRVIGEELGRQYLIGYSPRAAAEEGTWRRVMVRLPAHPRAKVRARTGYYAGEGPTFAATRLQEARH